MPSPKSEYREAFDGRDFVRAVLRTVRNAQNKRQTNKKKVREGSVG